MAHRWTREMDLTVEAQLKRSFAQKDRPDHPFITISREYGCDGIRLAELLMERLNRKDNEQRWVVLDRSSLIREANDPNLTEDHLRQLDAFGHSDLQSYIREILGMNNQAATVHKMSKAMRLFAARGHVIFLGGGSPFITRDLNQGRHIYLYASLDWRINNHARRWNLSHTDAREQVNSRHDEREDFVKTYMGADINDPQHYHLAINNALVSAEQAVGLVYQLLQPS